MAQAQINTPKTIFFQIKQTPKVLKLYGMTNQLTVSNFVFALPVRCMSNCDRLLLFVPLLQCSRENRVAHLTWLPFVDYLDLYLVAHLVSWFRAIHVLAQDTNIF